MAFDGLMKSYEDEHRRAEKAETERDAAHVLRDATVAQYRDRALAAEQRVAELEAALQLIAAGPRADGTYNRSREACREVAQAAFALGEVVSVAMRVPSRTVGHYLDERHYLGATGRGWAWSDEYGVLVLAKPTARYLPQDGTWLELVRWCLEGIPNGGSRQWSAVAKYLRSEH